MKRAFVLICALFLIGNVFAETKPSPASQPTKTTSVESIKPAKVVDYYIVLDKYDAFTAELKKMLNEGWQPWGDLSVEERTDMYGHTANYYIQAMVKFE
jgi:hypothetical protein